MLIDLVVGSALLLFGSFLFFWLRSPALRERIERPKHVFLQQTQAQDASMTTHTAEPQEGVANRE